jgi:hypothetical protein
MIDVSMLLIDSTAVNTYFTFQELIMSTKQSGEKVGGGMSRLKPAMPLKKS